MTKKLRNNGRPRPREGISDIAAYVPGRHKVKGSGKLHRLSSNETPLGASPNARAAYADVAQNLELYPDGAATELRQAIADVHGLNADNLICGAGSDELLNLLAYAYLVSGDEAVYSRHGFLVYEIAIRAAGAIPVVAAESDLTADVDALLGAVTPKTRVVFLANPNNPTGTYLPFDEINRLHQGLADDVLLVLDAAYAEYVRRNDYESGLELVSTSNNVVMTRTFSKIHGLASLRLGWVYAPAHIIDVLNRIRGPFNVSGPAIAAGIAAIKDREFVETAVRHNNKWLDWLTEQIGALGLDVTPSVGNFILIHFPDETGKTASDADSYLSERACLLRAVTGYGLPNALRMSVGTEEANRTVVEHLTAFMKN